MDPHVQVVPISGLGEGPHWNAEKQELLHVDISGQFVHRIVPSTGEQAKVRVDEGRLSLVVPVDGQPNQYVIGTGRTLHLMEWDGLSTTPTSLTAMFSVEPEQPLNRWNDGKCDSRGRLWAGTTSDDRFTGNLYRITDDIQSVVSGVGISNGIAWNRDNTLMFYNDTATRRVDVFDFDDEQGAISNRRTVYDFSVVGESGLPDGMNIDSDGNLWVGCYGGSQIIHLNPTTGQKIGSIQLPTTNITSIAFAGENLDEMYVTSAFDGLSDEQKLEQPAAGALFRITNIGVTGMSAGYSFKY